MQDTELPEKIEPTTPNFQTELAAKIAEIAPEVLSDGKLDVAKLRELVNGDAETSQEKFGLFWPGKRAAQALAQIPTTATLVPAPEESEDWDNTKNIFIEGDNLEVLKALQNSYRRKVKMIYIDPPYNTGEEFVYPDKFSEGLQGYLEYTGQKNEEGENVESKPETTGRRHSNWLSMLYPRLQLAKSLLMDDGVIFVSIDDHEVHNLRKLLDEVFGEENFIAQVTVIVKTEGRRYGYLAKTHEYVLVYAKDQFKTVLNELEKNDGGFKYADDRGGYNLTDLRNQNAGAFNSRNRPNLRYPFYVSESRKDNNGHYIPSLSKSEGDIEVNAIVVNGNESVWRWGREKAQNEIYNIIAKKGSDDVIRVFQKYRSSTTMAKTHWDEKDVISNKGTREVQELFDKKTYFDYPKPVALIEKALRIGTNKDDIVIDFFSGSATTAHAIMKLNAEDNGNRQHIQVQLPEILNEKSEAYKAGYKTIADISKERIRRAGKKILEDYKDIISERNTTLDVGFRVYKLAPSNFVQWNENKARSDIQQSVLEFAVNKKPDAAPEALLAEIMLQARVKLNANIEKRNLQNNGWVYIVDGGNLIAYVAEGQITEAQVNEIADFAPAKLVILDSAFNGNNALKINVMNICKEKFIKEFKTI